MDGCLKQIKAWVRDLSSELIMKGMEQSMVADYSDFIRKWEDAEEGCA